MARQKTRRQFLHAGATADTVFGLGEWAGLLPLSPANADEAKVTPDLVRFGPDLEPIVKLIEDTPREKCVAMMVEQLRKGVPYRIFMAALYHIQTNQVGHPLAVLHSAHELSLDLPAQERLLPLFWALDSFKFHQQRGDFASSRKPLTGLKPLAGKLPSADQAEQEFHAAMQAFDGERAERVIVAVTRGQGAARVAELVWHYGARDFTFIGHFAIWTANCWRPLQTVGWQHAEPILRVVVASIVGQDKALRGQPYAANGERVRKALDGLPAGWAEAGADADLTKDLLVLIRERKVDAACQLTVTQLTEGKAKAGAVWDAVHLAAGEMIMCAQKNAAPLHANTAANALHYAFQASGQVENRLLILLQAVGWMCLYRSSLARNNWLKEPKQITEIVGAKIPERSDQAVEEILAHLSFGPGGNPTADPIEGARGPQLISQPWRHEAASKVFTFAKQFADHRPLVREAFRLVSLKADWNPHRIKFPVAAWENCGWVSPEWRPHLLAAASYSFFGADALDTEVAKQAREAAWKL